MSTSTPFLRIIIICIFWCCSVIFVPVPQNTDLVIFMLVEIEAILLTVLELQKVIIQTFLAYADFLRCLLERFSRLVVKVSPLLDFLDNFTDLTLFGSSGSFLC